MFATKLNKRFAKKQNEMRRVPAEMGDGVGGLLVPDLDGFVYVTIGDKSLPVFNNRVAAQIGIKVWVGYAPEEPTLFQVLSTRSETPAGVETGFVGYAPARRYEWHAIGGGQDPLYVHLRAFTPLRLSVSDTPLTTYRELYVNLYRGRVYTGAGWVDIPRQDMDLATHLPTTPGKAAFVLISINTVGAIVQTKGGEVNIEDLALVDIPATPSNTINTPGAVRVYYGQTRVRDGRTNTDIVDLRFPGITNGGGGGAGDVIFEVDGALAVVTDAAVKFIVTRDMTIPLWYIYLDDQGSASSTIVDVNKNGTTIFTTQANRPELAFGDANGWAVSGTPDFVTFVEGDVISIDIDQIATGAGRMRIVGLVTGAGGSGSSGVIDYIFVREEQAANTDGGTFTQGSFVTRVINTEVLDVGGHCSISSNQITLAPGTYRCRITCPAFYVDAHKAILYNVTDAANELIGHSAYSGNANTDGVTTFAEIVGQFTIAASKVFEIRHQCAVTRATDGLGKKSNFGVIEIYTQAEFWRIA